MNSLKPIANQPVTARPKALPDNYLPTLDGWRAVAILLVLIGHASYPFFEPTGLLPHPDWAEALAETAHFGVSIFFGLSGFLICTRLLQEQAQNGQINLGNFYIRRAFRILPPYFTYLFTLGVVAAFGLIAINGLEWWSCFLFFRNYLNGRNAGWYTAHFWSLAVEEHFYLIWPGLLVLLGTRRAKWGAAAFAVSVAVWRSFEYRHQLVQGAFPEVGYILYRTDIRLDGLLWGCVVALLFNIPAWRGRLSFWLSPSRWFTLVGVFIVCLWLKPPYYTHYIPLLVPVILLGTVLHPDRAVGRLLETGPLMWLGRISYSLYIWQQLFVVGSTKVRVATWGPLQALPLNILVALAFAILSFYYIERPMIRAGRRLVSTSGRGKAASDPILVRPDEAGAV
jgi:peptidoglycan/LPS O-acetylase OafA/YrhL